MPLATTVVTNSLIGHGGIWTDPDANPQAPLATSCHFATIFWLFHAEFGRDPTQAEIVTIGNAQLAVGQMIPHGVRKNRPGAGALTLTAGSVLVFFAHPTAGHSCVAIQAQLVGGYNQMGWWSAGGANHGYSSHPTSQLQWGAGANQHKVSCGANWYELYEVPEGPARAIVRSLVQ